MAPDAFEVDDDDLLQILNDVVTTENEDRMQRAVAGCPKSALSIVEVDE
jgi:ferredoxin